jgi:AcrR family transcriptional regulator
MQEKSRRTNKQRSEATRTALLEAARELFVEKGYAATGTPEIVARAQVTRGALYHHFDDKAAIFTAVIEQEAKATAEAIEAATPPSLPPLEALITGGKVYLEAMKEKGRARLVLVEGPTVLGRERLEEIDAQNGNRTLAEGLQAAMDAGLIKKLPLGPLTAQLGAAFDRAALAVESGGSIDEQIEVLEALITGLRE